MPHQIRVELFVLQNIVEGGEVSGASGPERDHVHSNFVCPVIVIGSRAPELAY